MTGNPHPKSNKDPDTEQELINSEHVAWQAGNIANAETITVGKLIVELFTKWVEDTIVCYEIIPFNRANNLAKVDSLVFAQRNLIRIVREVTGIKE